MHYHELATDQPTHQRFLREERMNMEIVYKAIAEALQDSYPETTPAMVREVHEAMQKGESLPHGIIGMFARDSLTSLREHRK